MTNFIPERELKKDLEYRLRDIDLMTNKEEKLKKLLRYIDFTGLLIRRYPEVDYYYNKAWEFYYKYGGKKVENEEGDSREDK